MSCWGRAEDELPPMVTLFPPSHSPSFLPFVPIFLQMNAFYVPSTDAGDRVLDKIVKIYGPYILMGKTDGKPDYEEINMKK